MASFFSHPKPKSGVVGRSQEQKPSSTLGNSHSDQRKDHRSFQAGGGTTASPSPAPSVFRKWADDLFSSSPSDWLSPSSCSGCLSQVDDQEEDGNVVDEPAGNTSSSRAQSRFSFIDEDHRATAPPKNIWDENELNPSTTFESTDVTITVPTSQRGDSRNIARTAVGPDHAHAAVGIEVPQNCPLCLEAMSAFDILYPIKCSTACGYNFCVSCMSSLLNASREDYQVASDGSRQVKIRLQCPNCRADVAGIEDVIRTRKEDLASEEALAAADSELETSTAVPDLYSSNTAPVANCPDNYRPIRESRLKNRSGAPKLIRQKRVDGLIEAVRPMATPSLLRDQVLTVYGQLTCQNSASSASLISDAFSQGSSSSVEGQIVQPLSSTISNPFCTRPSDCKSAGLLYSPNRSHLLKRNTSPQVNRLSTPSKLRRTQSLVRSFSPPQPETKKMSPRSILDTSYFSRAQDSADEVEVQQLAEAKQKQDSPMPHEKKANSSMLCLEGIDFTEGEGSFFSDTIDLDWCCSGVNNSTPPEASTEDCGGYVDYRGEYHPCRNVRQEDQSGALDCELKEPCQGCIFRQGMRDSYDGNENGEELYYDSDPGQHFAITTWSPSRKMSPTSRSQSAVGKRGFSQHESTPTSRMRAKLGWRRRRQRLFKSNADCTAENLSSNPDGSLAKDDGASCHENPDEKLEVQQAFMYDYFSRNDNVSGNAMSTGVCHTQEVDAHDYVQDALNSKWRLQWHASAVRSSNRRNQSHAPPIVCDLWIERGYRHSRAEIVEPKLMWSQLNLHEKRHLGDSTIRPYRVSLFAIRRIFQIATAEDWDRMNVDRHTQASPMPMAKPNCLLVVRSSLGEDYLFEASCSEERDRIMHLLKMTTARLVSHAVVGNGDLMVHEFFNEELVE